MNDPTYLSIDIDFWNDLPPYRLRRDLCTIVEALLTREVPVEAVMNHQQMLKQVARSEARTLVNVDMHSDIYVGAPVQGALSCGNWVNYVPWREEGMYRWIRRHPLRDGECDYPWAFRGGNRTQWMKISSKRVRAFPAEVLENGVVAAGICMSPAFCDPLFVAVFREVVKTYEIRYRRGRYSREWA